MGSSEIVPTVDAGKHRVCDNLMASSVGVQSVCREIIRATISVKKVAKVHKRMAFDMRKSPDYCVVSSKFSIEVDLILLERISSTLVDRTESEYDHACNGASPAKQVETLESSFEFA